MKRKGKRNYGGKLVVGAVMLLFLGYGLFLITLKFFGNKTIATIKNYRMEMFERDETFRNQYTFVFDYEFVVSGEHFEGRSRVIKGPVYLKSKGLPITISYLRCCPRLNAPVRDFDPFYKPLIFLSVGLILFWFQRHF